MGGKSIPRMPYHILSDTCVHAYMNTCIHAARVCMYACMHVWLHACMYACMHVCEQAGRDMYVVYVVFRRMQANTDTHMYTREHACVLNIPDIPYIPYTPCTPYVPYMPYTPYRHVCIHPYMRAVMHAEMQAPVPQDPLPRHSRAACLFVAIATLSQRVSTPHSNTAWRMRHLSLSLSLPLSRPHRCRVDARILGGLSR